MTMNQWSISHLHSQMIGCHLKNSKKACESLIKFTQILKIQISAVFISNAIAQFICALYVPG